MSSLRAGLVSVIVPCYNVEKYIGRFLQSVLQQDYNHIELVAVNDGATDATRSIIEQFEPRLRQSLATVKIIDQKNKGLAGAVNEGLKHFTGEFLTWPDPDDWLEPDFVSTHVDAMFRYPEVGVIRNNANLVDESGSTVIGRMISDSQGEKILEGLFDDLLFRRVFFAPVCHFVRSQAFLSVNPSRSIFVSPKASQNQQMLIPLVESYPVLQIGKPLGNYRVREDSRSRASTRTPKLTYERQLVAYEVMENTVARLAHSSEQGLTLVRDFYQRNKFLPSAFRASMRSEAISHLRESNLTKSEKIVGHFLIWLRCSKLFQTLDRISRGIATRFLTFLFCAVVQIAREDCVWPRQAAGDENANKT